MNRTHSRTIGVLLALVALLAPHRSRGQLNSTMVAHEGGNLTEEQANALERAVEEKPDDLEARTKLLGYYFRRHLSSPEAKAARARHILWLVENRPEADILASPFAQLDATLEAGAYAKAKTLWLRQAERHANEPAVLGNAAEAFLLQDEETAQKLLGQAVALEPRNPHWPQQLAHLYQLHGRHAPTPEARREHATKALAEQRRAIELSPQGVDRFYLLTNLPEMALDAGRPQDAKAAAGQLAEEAARQRNNWNYGNAVHKAHVALGRVALEAGDVGEAKRHLSEAGRTPGSAQLNSFGPDFTLATELLKKGEREAVREYLTSVATFWKSGRKDVERWLKVLDGGGTPDFGVKGRFPQ